MKTLFLAVVLVSLAFGGNLRLEDAGYNTVAYIREDGRIEDASFMPIGRIVDEEDTGRIRVEDDSFNTLGYIDGHDFLDSVGDRIYQLTSDGRLKNHRFRDVVIIRDDGTVEALNFNVVLYTDGSSDDLKERVAVFLVYFSDLID